MKTLFILILLILIENTVKSQTLTCPPNLDIRLIDAPIDRNYGEPFTNATGNYKIHKSSWIKEYSCGSDTLLKDSITYSLSVNNQIKTSCTHTVIVRDLHISDLSFPDSVISFDSENITAFDVSKSGDITPTIVQLAYPPRIMITHSDIVIDLEKSFPKVLRTWKILNWCSGELKEFIQQLKINNKTTLSGIEANTITGNVINNFYYKVKATEQCSTYLNNDVLLLECELINRKRINFDTLVTTALPGNVNTLDLVMMQRHILGIQKLENNWQLIAADINSDEKINVADLVLLRRNIVGLTSDLHDGMVFVPIQLKEKILNNPFQIPNTLLSEPYNVKGIINDKFIILGLIKGDVNGQ